MKTVSSLLCLFLLSLAGSHAQEAQAGAANGEAPAAPFPEVQVEFETEAAEEARQRFLEKDEETQAEFAGHLQRSRELLSQQRIQEALLAINEAEAIWPEHPDVLNLKGACLVNLRDFDRAAELFAKSLELYPGFWQTRFNLAEMYFVRERFKESLEMFSGLLEGETEFDGATQRLIQYKVILNLIKLGEAEQAAELIAQYDIYDDTPIFYYSTAAVHFEAGERREAEEWVQRARQIYQRHLVNLFEDSLVELGWLFVL